MFFFFFHLLLVMVCSIRMIVVLSVLVLGVYCTVPYRKSPLNPPSGIEPQAFAIQNKTLGEEILYCRVRPIQTEYSFGRLSLLDLINRYSGAN